MILVGKQTVIASLGKEDLPAVFQFRNYAPILGWMDDYHHFQEEAERVGVEPYVLFRNWALNQMFGSKNFHFAIYSQSPAELIGAMWSTEVTSDTIWPTILMARKAWGKGFAEDAAETLLEAFLGPKPIDGKPEGGFSTIVVLAHKGNKPSLSFIKRMGFKETGYFPRGNGNMEQRIFALTKEDWLGRKERPVEERRKKDEAKKPKQEEEAA